MDKLNNPQKEHSTKREFNTDDVQRLTIESIDAEVELLYTKPVSANRTMREYRVLTVKGHKYAEYALFKNSLCPQVDADTGHKRQYADTVFGEPGEYLITVYWNKRIF